MAMTTLTTDPIPMPRRRAKRIAHAMVARILENFIDKFAEQFDDVPKFEGLSQVDSDQIAQILFGIEFFHHYKAGHSAGRQPTDVARGMR